MKGLTVAEYGVLQTIATPRDRMMDLDEEAIADRLTIRGCVRTEWSGVTCPGFPGCVPYEHQHLAARVTELGRLALKLWPANKED